MSPNPAADTKTSVKRSTEGNVAGLAVNPIELGNVVSVTDLVVEALRAAILDKRYAPGERILQEDVASALGVSRQPVRHAIREMINEGLLLSQGGRGYVVREFTDEYIRENYWLRALLESKAAALAAPRITPEDTKHLESLNRVIEVQESPSARLKANHEFHRHIRTVAESPTLERILDGLWKVVTVATPVTVPGRTERSVKEHKLIINALARRDPKAAQRAVEKHISNAEREYFDYQK